MSVFLFTSHGEDKDVIDTEGSNCIMVKRRGQSVNVKQEE